MEGKGDPPGKLRKRKPSLLSSDEESSPREFLSRDLLSKEFLHVDQSCLNQSLEGQENSSSGSKKSSPRGGSIKITGGSSPRIGSSTRSSREKSPRPRKLSENDFETKSSGSSVCRGTGLQYKKEKSREKSEEVILSVSERVAQSHRKTTRRSQSANCAIQEKSRNAGNDDLGEQKRSTTNPDIIFSVLPKSDQCFYVSVMKTLNPKILNIESVNYNTMHLVESGYFGIEVSNESHQYIVYSHEKFKIKSSTNRFSTEKVPFVESILAHHDELKIIELFKEHFPIIVKLRTQQNGTDFKSIFLTIMFSIYFYFDTKI